ncbi:MAG: tetratricopeptide repeat protein [Chloroflexi bacterium CFX4]|nr:tetratricopeptide repeat protein [Chloroflexi bacterium CFX4]MDL1923255.1 tetratricopeptide repeat protein [Chloroflexi bacterium CFX3]
MAACRTLKSTVRLWLLFALMASACGVRVEVAPQTPPPPTATAMPAYNEYNGLTRGVAAPRFTFSGQGGARVALFMQPAIVDVYTLRERYVWFHADYDATWYDSAQGNARLRLSLYSRTDSTQAWIALNSGEQELTTLAAPNAQRSEIGATFYPEQKGVFHIRIELAATVFTPDQQFNPLEARELRAFVFSPPDEGINLDPKGLTPRFGVTSAERPLLDWRAWLGNPCEYVDIAPSPMQEGIARACEAVAAEDVTAVALALRQTADALSPRPTDVVLRAWQSALWSAAALTYAQLDDLAAAKELFEAAMQAWQALDRPFEFSVARHNLAYVCALEGQTETALIYFQQVQELRAQIGDEGGMWLAQANRGYLADNRDLLWSPRSYFETNELPQLEIVNRWIAAFDE